LPAISGWSGGARSAGSVQGAIGSPPLISQVGQEIVFGFRAPGGIQQIAA